MRLAIGLGANYAPVTSAPAVGTVFASDTFSGSAVELSLHTPETGGAWVNHPNSTGGNAQITALNRVWAGASGQFVIYYITGSPTTADYDVSSSVVLLSDNNLHSAGVCARMDTTATTFYMMDYNTNGNLWRLFRFNAGVATAIGSTVAQTLTVGQAYVAKLSVVGTSIKGYVDGAEIMSGTDASIAGPGKAGFRFNNAASATVGLHLDNFEGRNAA